MNRQSIRRLAAPALALVLSVGLAACGRDSEGPTSATPPLAVAGNYEGSWRFQALRRSDGFRQVFHCWGTLTLIQKPATGSLSGFIGVQGPYYSSTGPLGGRCQPESYDLRGSVSSEGAIEFTTDGPRPPEGPCPGGKNVRLTGKVSSYIAGDRPTLMVDVRGETNVTCPELGEHTLTYAFEALR